MLEQLTIRDFAIVDRLTIDWSPGFNVVTGETGAGKSIIVDAVSALLGGRLNADFVRAGARRSIVEGVFRVQQTADLSELEALLDEYGLELDDGALILTREVAGVGGRGLARVGGRAVPTSVLQQVGERLVDIHGQSEHLSLLRSREHLDLLDRFAGLGQQRVRLSALVADLRATERERGMVRDNAYQAEREQSLLRHEVAEIEGAGLRDGEEEELALARDRLRNVERLRAAVGQAYAALKGDDDHAGAVDLLAQAATACASVAICDPSLDDESQALDGAAAQAEESARSLRKYLEAIQDDPQQLADIEERLLLIAELKRKFGRSIVDVLAYAERARERLSSVERQEQVLAELDDRRAEILAALSALASEVSARRTEAAERLRIAVEAELGDLNMRGTAFMVHFERLEDAGGVPVMVEGEQRMLRFDATGVDKVEFLISPNPGEGPKGLGRIASGGELSRVSLALKTILSQVDRRSTLIFDEIDVGVGGRSAPVLGQKLSALTAQHQVLCVTHMPGLAAYADSHLVVTKGTDGDVSRVTVRELGPDNRVDELAAMLGGSPGGEGARRNARELLEGAATWKRASQGRGTKEEKRAS